MADKEIKVEGGCCGCLVLILALIGFLAVLKWFFGIHVIISN